MTGFAYPQKVLFQHCDPAGIVFYPRYFEMLNATVEAWFEQRLGHSFARLHGEVAAGVPTAGLEITFSAPSRLGDDLLFTLWPERLGRSSVGLCFTADCGAERRLEMRSTLVFVALADGRPRPWPEALRSALERERTAG
ncbi:acyl-CoA thioesterase [Acidimangrovimonas pyrenivorans]|uniref:Acyl-CoA thioesterase n=1 Tax=Acidimangrovimonas pyrenivorans TaxID=2030798 RepID=A0ABV7AJA2_9RHOB